MIAGQVTDEARAALARRDPASQVLALTDRVWHASEAYERAALLVEEAARRSRRATIDDVSSVSGEVPR